MRDLLPLDGKFNWNFILLIYAMQTWMAPATASALYPEYDLIFKRNYTEDEVERTTAEQPAHGS